MNRGIGINKDTIASPIAPDSEIYIKGDKDMNYTITVPTKMRPKELIRWFSKHYDPQFHYCIAIESQDWKLYDEVKKIFYRNVKYLKIKNNKGLCYARNSLCQYALDRGDKFVFMSDDNANFDIWNVPKFMTAIAIREQIIWLGGFFSCRGLFDKKLLDEAKEKNTPFYQPNCVGTVYALRLSYWKIEKFDENIFYAEDDEYWLRMRRIFYPYRGTYVYIPFEIKKKRHAEGGHTVWKSNEDLVRADVDYVNKKLGVDIMGVRETKTPGIFMYWAKWKKYDEYLFQQAMIIAAGTMSDHLVGIDRGIAEQDQLLEERDKQN